MVFTAPHPRDINIKIICSFIKMDLTIVLNTSMVDIVKSKTYCLRKNEFLPS